MFLKKKLTFLIEPSLSIGKRPSNLRGLSVLLGRISGHKLFVMLFPEEIKRSTFRFRQDYRKALGSRY